MRVKIGEAVKGGIIGAVINATMAGLVNYYLFSVPATVLQNGINHAITAAISGFIAGFMALIVFMVQQARSQKIK